MSTRQTRNNDNNNNNNNSNSSNNNNNNNNHNNNNNNNNNATVWCLQYCNNTTGTRVRNTCTTTDVYSVVAHRWY